MTIFGTQIRGVQRFLACTKRKNDTCHINNTPNVLKRRTTGGFKLFYIIQGVVSNHFGHSVLGVCATIFGMHFSATISGMAKVGFITPLHIIDEHSLSDIFVCA